MLKSTQKVKPDAPRSHRWLIGNPSARSGLPTEALKTPETIKAIATVAGDLPELNVKSLLQRRLHTWTANLGDAKLRLNQKCPFPCEQAPVVPEVATKDVRELSTKVLLTCGSACFLIEMPGIT